MRKVRLGEIATMKYGKLPPERISETDGFPIFTGYRISGYATEFLYEQPMLLVVARGVGGTGDVKISPPQSWITNLSIVLGLDGDQVDKQYLFYSLGRERLKEKLNTGAAQAQITIDSLSSYEILLPDVEVQRRVGEVLSAYDDLIENNRRRAKLLEEYARLLYREWFVHLRFPGHEHVKILDGVPEGWEKRRLIDIARITMGQSPTSDHYNTEEVGFPFHQGVSNFGDRFVKHQTWCDIRGRMAEAGDILFSVRAPVGRLNVARDELVLGRGLSAMRSRNDRQSMLFYQLGEYFYKEDMIGGGAIFASVTKRDLENQLLMCPTDQLATDFEEFATTADAQIANLTAQNEKLRQTRDLLLPRLMSGALSV